MVNFILSDAIKNRASDIHIEPQEGVVEIRERIDGELKTVVKFSNEILPSLVSRIKIIAKLDIAESRSPQDGRTKILVNERNVDLRIAIVPTIHGEKVELRVLDPKESRIEIDKIGFESQELKAFTELIWTLRLLA